MKKNWTVKVAALMLALTMITACFVGSTFAKYVTKAQGEGQARVAKWGILLTMNGAPFAKQYETHDDTYNEDGKHKYSVISSMDDYVVAPGTSSKDKDVNGDMVATVKGTPEVATRYTLEIKNWKDVVLPAMNGYVDYTQLVLKDGEYGYFNTFDLEGAYTPIKWNLVISGKDQEFNLADKIIEVLQNGHQDQLDAAIALGFTENGCSIFSAMQILKKVAGKDEYKDIVEEALSGIVSGGTNFQLEVTDTTLKMSYDFKPGKEMDYTFTLSWQWPFEVKDNDGEVIEIYDQADTYLGNIAAGVEGIIVPEGASTQISVEFTATATQID
ncbi:MAG: hypothetical protein K6G56_00855 [Clostridiales bacterium]|nr:hypothetical protein [Clostridiales bacterium]